MLGHIYEESDVVFVSPHVLVLNQPFDLLFDHLFRWQKHILENLDQFCLQLSVGDPLPHLHYLNDRFLRPKNPKLNNTFVVFFATLLCRQL